MPKAVDRGGRYFILILATLYIFGLFFDRIRFPCFTRGLYGSVRLFLAEK